jgi:hypothetical protein
MADGVSLGAIFQDLMDEGPEFQSRINDMLYQMKQNNKKKSQLDLGGWCSQR